jgi:aminopeptidase S
VFSDDFEIDRGWTANPNGTDTAPAGRFERANPETTSSNGTTTQLGTTPSGSFDLVTGGLAGASAGVNDLDGGVTSIQSPLIDIPATGTTTLSLKSYLAHLNNATNADFLRVQIVGSIGTATAINRLGAATNVGAAFVSQSFDISAFAGDSVRIVVSSADNATASLVEAAVDDVLITNE